jgi:hypothetical protein
VPQEFNLDPGAVSQTEQMLLDTGTAVNTQAGIARDSITGLSGSGWSGGASMVASNKQNNEFAGAVAKLHNEINRVSESLGMGRVGAENTDQESGDAIQAVPVELGNFSRI